MSLLVFPLINDIILRRLIKVIFETELSLLVKETKKKKLEFLDDNHLFIFKQVVNILIFMEQGINRDIVSCQPSTPSEWIDIILKEVCW